MALKRHFSDDEKFGLTEEECKLGEKYLRKHKTAGAIPEMDSIPLYELYMVGCSFLEIHQQYPQYTVDKIILTAALRGWCRDRDRMMGSLRDRVQAKVVKSVIEQVDFLTAMLTVVNVEQMEEMKKFILDPDNNPKPTIRIQSIKDYKEITDTLQKLVAGATGSNKKSSPMFDTLNPPDKKSLTAKDEQEVDPAMIIAGEITN